MVSQKTLKAIEFDKILSKVSEYAVLYRTKDLINSFSPLTCFSEVDFLLRKTEEAYNLLYKYNVSGVYFFDDVSEELNRVDKMGTLNNAELLRIASNLKSARILRTSILSINDSNISILPEIASRLFTNLDFEKEISSKILSEDAISDNATPQLYSIRRSIRSLNAKIREQLNSYVHGSLNKYLQDAVVTMRQDRYVIPVKSEYRSFVKGFIHDQSSSGATVFIEPEVVMELNNDLKRALLDEQVEIYKILSDLSIKVSFMSDAIRYNAENIIDIDTCFAKAIYSFKNKCTKPLINDKGIVDIRGGRHPLIDKDKVVPVSINFGKDYNFLLITGPNTGGKTVTLKLVGLLTAMTMCGLFIPAYDESSISIFSNIFCDIGDEQSIEENLSTFSSHIKNLINIISSVNNNSLVLIDEIGAGTDPDEGSALALAIIKKLLDFNCFGIITTHYSRLKEFSMESGKIENASMEFDSVTLKPVYKLNIGIPGSSNALEIAKILGLEQDIIDQALLNLSDSKISFEKVLKKAEESRRKSESLSFELSQIKKEKEAELEIIKAEKEKIIKEREKIYQNAKIETKRIVADKLSEAEEIISDLKTILKNADLDSKDIIKASQLKNKLMNSKYLTSEDEDLPITLIKPNISQIIVGNKVYVKSLGAYGKILQVNKRKNEVDVLIGSIKSVVKINDLYNSEKDVEKETVKIQKSTLKTDLSNEINVIGKTSLEALDEVRLLIDRAIVNNLSEVKIIHGVGEGILLKEIRAYLKTDKHVKQFRKGRYGEGENGVTFVTLR